VSSSVSQGAIDFHAHMVPDCLWRAAEADDDPYALGVTTEDSDQGQMLVIPGQRKGPTSRERRVSLADRLASMDDAGVGIQVVSMSPLLLRYDQEVDVARQMCRDVNEDIAATVSGNPDRFRGLATLPVQDVDAAIAELEYAKSTLGLAGAQVDTRTDDAGWDDPRFEPLFQAAEDLGVILFFHPSYSLVWQLSGKYHLGNTIGNPAEDILAGAALIYGGVLERHSTLSCLIAHGAGPLCFGIGRLDRGWLARPEARNTLKSPPSRYLRRLYYDCITWSGPALRFLIDTVGAERVVLGSDFPYDMGPSDPVGWLESLDEITTEEKDLILRGNAAGLLGLEMHTHG
jgi:aminocarboxymuconate-semialdehyde decarboxylase